MVCVLKPGEVRCPYPAEPKPRPKGHAKVQGDRKALGSRSAPSAMACCSPGFRPASSATGSAGLRPLVAARRQRKPLAREAALPAGSRPRQRSDAAWPTFSTEKVAKRSGGGRRSFLRCRPQTPRRPVRHWAWKRPEGHGEPKPQQVRCLHPAEPKRRLKRHPKESRGRPESPLAAPAGAEPLVGCPNQQLREVCEGPGRPQVLGSQSAPSAMACCSPGFRPASSATGGAGLRPLAAPAGAGTLAG